jgi:hypothetical protein
MFLLPLASIGIWFLFIVLDIGKAGIGNLIEIFIIVPISVTSAYLKFFIFDSKFVNKSYGIIAAYTIVVAVSLALRLFMPFLPE